MSESIENGSQLLQNSAGNIMFFTWINNMIIKKQAYFNKENKNIIELSNFSASWFCIGRESERNTPFLGIQENMTPWFFEIPWARANASIKQKKLHLSCATSPNDSDLTISIPIREKRLGIVIDKLNKDKEQFLDFRMIKVENNGNLAISKKQFKRIYLTFEDEADKIVAKPLYREEVEINEQELQKTFENKMSAFDDGISVPNGKKIPNKRK